MAETEKRENSVLFSLRELQKIEEDRVTEEEDSTRAAEEAKIRAKMEAERKEREAEAARVAAEQNAESARLGEIERKQREERMRVNEAEARARAEAQGVIEQQRLQQEMEIRRVEASKKRPTTLIAVAATLVLLVGGLIFWVVQKNAEAEKKAKETALIEAQAKKDKANAEDALRIAAQAKADAKKTREQMASLSKDMKAAQDALDKADSDAGRANARKRLANLKSKYARMERARIERKKREKFKLSDKCKNNPLCVK